MFDQAVNPTQDIGDVQIENEYDSARSIDDNLSGTPAVPIATTPRNVIPPSEPESDHEPINNLIDSPRRNRLDSVDSPTPSIDMSQVTFAGPVIPDTYDDHHSWTDTETAWPEPLRELPSTLQR